MQIKFWRKKTEILKLNLNNKIKINHEVYTYKDIVQQLKSAGHCMTTEFNDHK